MWLYNGIKRKIQSHDVSPRDSRDALNIKSYRYTQKVYKRVNTFEQKTKNTRKLNAQHIYTSCITAHVSHGFGETAKQCVESLVAVATNLHTGVIRTSSPGPRYSGQHATGGDPIQATRKAITQKQKEQSEV